MAAKAMKSAFISGIHYLDHQQYSGQNYGAMQMINRRLEFGKGLYSKDLYAHYGCVNAVEFSNDGEWLVSGGDDKRILIWNVDKALSCSNQPKPMKGEHNSNIFCLGFNASHSKLFSAGNDEQVILHDVNTAEILDVFLHDEAVYGLSVDPSNENIYLSACDDGRVLMWDIRNTSNDANVLASCSSPYHAVMYNPVESQYVATGNAKDGVCLWDTRKPRVSVMKYGPSKGAMSVRFNSTGTFLLALRRRLPPVLYDVTSGLAVAEFDHPEYYNSCTMKSCCFAGERDQYILSGSDDFKLYVWKVPSNLKAKKRVWISEAHFVLRGHRSIVNQVRYNNTYGVLASSGVEKIIKLWSSFQISHNEAINGYVTSKDLSRKVYTHEEYINLVLESGQFMTHDYSHHSVQEDPRMMAFFDSLVQRDIEGWTSDSVDASDILSTCMEVPSSGTSDSSSSSSTESDDESRDNPIKYMCLEYFRPKKTMTSTEEIDPSVDKISQLIAKKRREAKLKNARASIRAMCDKDVKVMKKELRNFVKYGSEKKPYVMLDGKCKRTLSQCSENDSHSNQEASTSSSIFKDKHKMLRKKRAKLAKDAVFSDSSSDSDNRHKNPVAVKNELSEPNCSVMNELKEHKVAEVKIKEPVEISEASEDMHNGIDKEDISIKDAGASNPSGDSRNGNIASSNSLISFSTKNGKHSNRNYRKRSAEDRDDAE